MDQDARLCSTRTALMDMLATASRKAEKVSAKAVNGSGPDQQNQVEQARAAVEELARRLAAHRQQHGC